MKSGRPSRTALGVARWVDLAGREEALGRLLPEGAREWTGRLLEACGPAERRRRWWHGRRWYRALQVAWHDRSLPGMTAHLFLRKRLFEARARAAVADGIGQVVLLGAGFDTLGERLAASLPGTRLLAVDHPATHLARPNLLPPGRVRRLALDLSDGGLARRLETEADFDRRRPCLLLAEGLMMYLPRTAFGALARDLATRLAPGSRWLLGHLAPGPEDGRVLGRFDRWHRWRLARSHEPLLWSAPRAELEAEAAALGLTVSDRPDLVRDYAELLEGYPLQPPGTSVRELFLELERPRR